MTLRISIFLVFVNLVFFSCQQSIPRNEILFNVRKMLLADDKFDKNLDNVTPRIDSITPINATEYYEDKILSNKKFINRWRNMNYNDTLSDKTKEIGKLLLEYQEGEQAKLIEEYRDIDKSTVYYNCYILYLDSNIPVYRVKSILNENYKPLYYEISYMNDD